MTTLEKFDLVLDEYHKSENHLTIEDILKKIPLLTRNEVTAAVMRLHYDHYLIAYGAFYGISEEGKAFIEEGGYQQKHLRLNAEVFGWQTSKRPKRRMQPR